MSLAFLNPSKVFKLPWRPDLECVKSVITSLVFIFSLVLYYSVLVAWAGLGPGRWFESNQKIERRLKTFKQ
jgi:hypothetical protein